MGPGDSNIILAVRWLRQEDCHEFPAKLHSKLQVSLGYRVRYCVNKQQQQKDRRVQKIRVKRTLHYADGNVLYYDRVLY